MIIHNEKIILPPGKNLYLFGFGDVHYNVSDCDKERVQRLVDWTVKTRKKGHVIRILGMGDYIDTFSSSERASIVGAKGGQGLHDTSLEVMDVWARDQSAMFTKAVAKTKGCWLGMLEGHHYMNFQTSTLGNAGQSTTQWMCEQLGARFFGTVVYGELQLAPDEKTAPLSLGFVGHHGWGGSRTKGARATQRERFGNAFPTADLVFMGHDHEKIALTNQDLVLKNGELKSRKRYYIGTGSFLRGYAAGRTRGSYIEERGYAPAELGVSIVTVNLEQRRGQWRVDMHVSI